MEVKFFSPSYRRPERSTTQRAYPFVTLVVAESEAEAYRANGNRVVTVPDAVQGNLCRVRNYILDNFFGTADCIVLMDDDYKGVYFWQHQLARMMGPDELEEFAADNSFLCAEWGFFFWGINVVDDKGAYREHTPFSTLSYIGGPFQAHLRGSEIRYSEDLPLKEDYDMTLQHVHRYGGCLRINYAYAEVKRATNAGGCAVYRNTDAERDQFRRLQRKWGEDVVKADASSRRGFDFNPILKIPVSGV